MTLNDLNNFHRELSAVRSLVRVTISLLTTFTALQSGAIRRMKMKELIVGSSVAK